MSVTLSLDPDGRHIVLSAPPRYVDLVKKIPGARYRPARQSWTLPLSWGSCLAARTVFGAELAGDDGFARWAGVRHSDLAVVGLAKAGADVGQDTHRDLYPFQRAGVAFLSLAWRGILADEMGLGKTPQAIEALRQVAQWDTQLAALPALVVCTNSMTHKWADEFARWWPEVSVAVASGAAAKRRKIIESGANVVVINWEALRVHSRMAGYGSIRLTDKQKEDKELNLVGFRTVIADEAHRAKDARSQQTRCWWKLAHDATYRFALTGTPIANQPGDLWAILHGVSPEDWPSRTAYLDRFTNNSINVWGGMEILGLTDSPAERAEFHSLLSGMFLRRTKAEVLPQLPAKTYSTRTVTMGAKQAKAYGDMAKHMVAQIDAGLLVATSPLTALGRLTQLAAALPVVDEDGAVTALSEPSCKVEALLDILDESSPDPVVVFAASRKLIELCAEVLDRKKISYGLVTGAVSPAERATAVARFQAGEMRAILCTTGAGGEGITLTRASRLVFLSRPWSAVQSAQAEDRVHRIGQANAVEIIDVLTDGTIESLVHSALVDKAVRLDEITQDSARLRAAVQGEVL